MRVLSHAEIDLIHQFQETMRSQFEERIPIMINGEDLTREEFEWALRRQLTRLERFHMALNRAVKIDESALAELDVPMREARLKPDDEDFILWEKAQALYDDIRRIHETMKALDEAVERGWLRER